MNTSYQETYYKNIKFTTKEINMNFKMKVMGVNNGKRVERLVGVADLFLMCPNMEYMGMFIEMKFGKGKQSASQIKFQKNAERLGYKYIVTNSLENFMQEVNSYIR